MAADTRDPAVVRPRNENALGETAGMNTAGVKYEEAGVADGLKSIRIRDLQEVHQKPCVRESFMTGIGGGFGIGALRFTLGGSVWSSCNWAVASFVLGSIAMHEWCQRRRFLERQGMKRAVDVLERQKDSGETGVATQKERRDARIKKREGQVMQKRGIDQKRLKDQGLADVVAEQRHKPDRKGWVQLLGGSRQEAETILKERGARGGPLDEMAEGIVRKFRGS